MAITNSIRWRAAGAIKALLLVLVATFWAVGCSEKPVTNTPVSAVSTKNHDETGGATAVREEKPAVETPKNAVETPKNAVEQPKTVDRLSTYAIAKLVQSLDRLSLKADEDRAVTTLVQNGDASVKEIERVLLEGSPRSGMRHRAVIVLKRVNTDQARELLFRMAIGELSDGNRNQESWAARGLIECDPDLAWKLLTAQEPLIIAIGLNALKRTNKPLDADHFKLVKSCLKSADQHVSCTAADVMSNGSSDELARQAVVAIADALAKVPTIPGGNELQKTVGASTTESEEYYGRYGNALANAQVDNQTLRGLSDRLEGTPRDMLMIVLAQRGDASVHCEIVRVAQDDKAGLLKAWAVDTLSKIGTSDDLAILAKIEESDPLVRAGALPPPHPSDGLGPTYPVRQAAVQTIREIKKKM